MVNRVKTPRDRARPLQAYVNDAERKIITDKAERYNMTISAFIRATCLGRALGPCIDDLAQAQARRAVR